MDSPPRSARVSWWLLAALAVPALARTAALPGCAEPCLDDGLGQQYCPELDTEAMSGSSGPGDGDGDPATDTEDEGCPALDVILIPRTPTVVLLVDQSGSMDQDFGGATRWEVITDVLINPQTGVVPQFADSIRLGLTLYTSVEGNTMGGECPMLTEVDPSIDNAAAIESTMSMALPVQDTPTGESLDVVWQKLDALEEPGRKYIVLATDGEPDTCATPNPQEGQPESVAAAEAAFAAGIETFVISVGDEVSEGHLQDMANAGQGVQDATFYQALDQDALDQAFEEILGSVRSCELDLMSPLSAEDAQGCTLEVNGEAVGLDDPNGWQLNGDMQIELLGSSCDTLQAGVASVEMECACTP